MKQIIKVIILLSIVFIEISLSANKSSEHQIKSEDDAIAWLNRFGYNPCLNSDHQCSISLSSIIESFQKYFRLKITGKIDEETKKQMGRSRCGNKDKEIAELNSAVYKWKRSPLKYSIRSYPIQISEPSTRRIIHEAFQAWLVHIPLQVEETCSTCPADIVLTFEGEEHSDGYPFDGNGGTLAHAYFPEDGRVHFDKDEAWTESFNDYKTNLFLVAVHELGHTFGLSHVNDPNSIMYPSYQSMPKNKILPEVDRISIQAIYGKRQPPTQTPTTTRFTTPRNSVTTPTVSSEIRHPRCGVFLDAAFDHPDGTLHTFSAGILWRYLYDDDTWEDRASTYKQTYSKLPNRIAAGAYNSRTKEVTFFTDTHVYHYVIDNRNRARFQNKQPLTRNLHNSIVGAIYYRSEIYVITRKTIRLFQLDNGYEQSDERDLSEEFPRFTGTVTTAFSDEDLHHFFTTDRRVYIWSERLNTWQTFGKPMETNWFACSTAEIDVTIDMRLKEPSKYRGGDRHHRHY